MTAKNKSSAIKKDHAEIISLMLTAILAYLLTNVRIGGVASPFAVSLLSASSPAGAVSAVIGTAAAVVIGGCFWKCIPEIAAMVIMSVFVFFFRRSTIRLRMIASASAYFICSCAVTAGSGAEWVMFAAVLFRSLMCGIMTMCFSELPLIFETGLGKESSVLRRRAFCACAVYILVISALCARDIFIINPGRIAAAFICIAAARKFGVSGASVMGILSAAAFLLSDTVLARSGAILAFSALAAGIYMPRGKYRVDGAFILICFAVTAAAGMPSGTPEFIADMSIAAAVYCIVPESIYINRLNGIVSSGSEYGDCGGDRLTLAAKILEEVNRDAQDASQMLYELSEKQKMSVADAVKSYVCGSLCRQRVCSAVCGGDPSGFMEGCFRSAQSIGEKKGLLLKTDLPTGFEGCTEKTKLAESYTRELGIAKEKMRRDSDMRRLLDGASEQLEAECAMLADISGTLTRSEPSDELLTECAIKIISEDFSEVSSAVVTFNGGKPVCEAYISSDKAVSPADLTDVTERLGGLLGYDLENPVVFGCAGMYRICWYGGVMYYPDCRFEYSAAESICGDSHCCFEDGKGNFFIILSDGMGKGGRAAAQSSMAVNMLKRLLLSGIGSVSAVKTLNVLLNAVSSDEVFTTIDLLRIDCFTGNASLIKMGAAPTAVYTEKDGEGSLMMIGECSAPVGIIGRTEVNEIPLELDENSRIIMMTDGIGTECESYIHALMENKRLTGEQLAEKLVAYAVSLEEGRNLRCDDKTAAAVRLYRPR